MRPLIVTVTWGHFCERMKDEGRKMKADNWDGSGKGRGSSGSSLVCECGSASVFGMGLEAGRCCMLPFKHVGER